MKGGNKVTKWFGTHPTIFVFLLLYIVASIVFRERNFFSFRSLMNVCSKGSINGGLLALGMTFVILIAQIDLSVGATLAFAGAIGARVGNVHPLLGLLVAIGIGLACGLLAGFLVAKLGINSWIASLSMMLGLRGVVLLVTHQHPVVVTNEAFMKISTLSVGGVPIMFIYFVVLTIICYYISRKTPFGMGLYAVGGNEEAAKMMGLKVTKIKISAYVWSGFMAGLNGYLLAASLRAAEPNAGNAWETDAIAMCAIGGVQLSGGKGTFIGTFFGALVFALIQTIFNYTGLGYEWQNTLMGVLVLIAIGIQSDVFRVHRHKNEEEIEEKA